MKTDFNIKLKLLGILAALLIIGTGVYQFITHPFTNTNIIEYVEKDLTDNRSRYNRLTNFLNTIETKYPHFNLNNHPRQGLIYKAIGPFVEDSSFVKDTIVKDYKLIKVTNISAPEKKEKDFDMPNYVHRVMIDLKIDNVRVNYSSDEPYVIFYKGKLNHSMTGKRVYLYYFPKGYQNGYFNNDKELLKNLERKNWLYKMDDNWLLKSEGK